MIPLPSFDAKKMDMPDDTQKPSDDHREMREAEREYWDDVLTEAKSGGMLYDALSVIVKMHQSIVDGEPLPTGWENYLQRWLHIADLVQEDWARSVSISAAPNVEHIRTRMKRD